MKGQTGAPMQAVEYAPKKKGNVKCAECRHLVYKPIRPSKKQVKPSYYCEEKKQPRWYTARCYCKAYEERGGNEKDRTV